MQDSEPKIATIETAPPNIMVIFGGGGDLTRRKLIPALYYLCRDRYVPEAFAVLGVDRREQDAKAFRAQLDSGSRKFLDEDIDESHWRKMLQCAHYMSGDFADAGVYARLTERLIELSADSGITRNYLFYLATPPQFFGEIATQLGRAGLLDETDGNWRRVIIEKPFGRDLASARNMNRLLHAVMDERQIYRIDHYLGKETVQNMLTFRFANSTIEPIWNRQYY